MLQNLFLTTFVPHRTTEYIDLAFERRLDEFDIDKSEGIFHLPTWRFDLVPDNSVDVVTAIFVLPEINDFALLEFVKQTKRIVRDGGVFIFAIISINLVMEIIAAHIVLIRKLSLMRPVLSLCIWASMKTMLISTEFRDFSRKLAAVLQGDSIVRYD